MKRLIAWMFGLYHDPIIYKGPGEETHRAGRRQGKTTRLANYYIEMFFHHGAKKEHVRLANIIVWRLRNEHVVQFDRRNVSGGVKITKK